MTVPASPELASRYNPYCPGTHKIWRSLHIQFHVLEPKYLLLAGTCYTFALRSISYHRAERNQANKSILGQ